MKFSTLLTAKFAARKNAGQSSKRDANKRNAPRARILNLEALESRELLDASPIASLASASASDDSALVCAAVLDETAAIDLSNAESEPTTWVVNSVDDSATTKGTLRYALANAQDGDTIKFNATTFKTMKTIELIGTDLPITKSITITGPKAGVTLDACGACRVFNIADGAGNVSISNITIANGYAATGSGGGIYSGASNVLTVDNCVFTNNETARTSGYYGGGIYSASAVTVNKSSFSGNYAYGAGVSGAGEAVYVANGGSLSFSNSEITQPISLSTNATLTITDCNIHVGTDKIALLVGNNAQITISGSQFTKNAQALQTGSKANVNISSSVFTSNGTTTQSLKGGAISIADDSTVIIENNCEFAENSSKADGGAVYIAGRSTVTITDAKFDRNSSRYGGAIFFSGRGGSTFTIEKSIFTSNNSTMNGGAFGIGDYTINSQIKILSSTFESNASGGNGGAVDCFSFNPSSETNTVEISDSSFSSNVAIGSGGALAFTRYNANSIDSVSIANSSFTSNSGSSGGAIYNAAGNLTLTGDSMTGNTASSNGGGLYSSVGEFTGTNVLLADNTATNGGGVYQSGALSYLYNATVAKNTAKFGGGVYNTTRLYLTNTIVAENTAEDGVDVWTADGSDTRTMLRSTLVRDASHLTGIDVYASGSTNKVGTASAPINAGFVNSSKADYHLTSSSVAVNAGNNGLVTVNVDLDGNARIVNDLVDLGAYEYAIPTVPVELDAPTITSTDAAKTSITITWDAVPNASKYAVYWRLASGEWNLGAKSVQLPNTSYTIPNLTAGTTYEIRMRAIGDGVYYKSSKYSATVTVTTDRADGPIVLQEPAFTLTPSETTIKVNWPADPNATKYALWWKLPSASTWTPKTIQLPNTSFTITGLTPNTTYEVRMRAYGDGTNYLNSVLRTSGDRVTTLPDVPEPDPEKLETPKGVDATAKTATTITASWNAVPNASQYQFIWKNKTDAAYTTVKLDADTTSYKIAGLDTDSTYYWKVRALGDGVRYLNSDYCATVVDQPQQTLETPAIKSTVSGDTSIKLTWTGDENADGYRIMYKGSSDSAYTTVNVNGASTSSYTISGLAQGKYVLKIASIGDGIDYKSSAYTALVTVQVPDKLATPVISSVASTAGTVTVNWGKVANASSYTIKCGEETYTGVSASATSYTIPDLNPSTSYSVTVQAIASVASRNSDVSAAKTIKTKALTKLATPTLTVSATTGKTATLTWTVPTNGDVAGYFLAYRPSSSATYKTVYLNATATSYKLTGLTQNTSYKFKIQALGDTIETSSSAYSAIKTGTTTSASSAILDLGDELFDELEEDYDLLAANFVS